MEEVDKMCIHTDGSEKSIPEGAELISDNGISRVWRSGDLIYKRSTPFLIENELWCYQKMWEMGVSPFASRYDKYTLVIENLGDTDPITYPQKFLHGMDKILNALEEVGIRHGDMTEYSIIVKDNRPYLIDFAESRLASDPRPDKRPEGDREWATRVIAKLCGRPERYNTRSAEQFEIVRKHVDFTGKMVADIGCGRGDLAWDIALHGAKEVHGADLIFEEGSHHLGGRLTFYSYDLDRAVKEHWRLSGYDIGILFSVLPYLSDPFRALRWMKDNFTMSLIECQYAGDGPGLADIKDDLDMQAMLEDAGWKSVEAIGRTEVKGRGYRTIWLCQ